MDQKQLLIKFIIEFKVENFNDISFQRINDIVLKIRDELLEYDYFGFEITKNDDWWIITLVYNKLTDEEMKTLAIALSIIRENDIINIIAKELGVDPSAIWLECGMKLLADTTNENEYLDAYEPEVNTMFDSISGNKEDYVIYSDLTNNVIGTTNHWRNVVKILDEFRTDDYKAVLNELSVCSISELLSTFFAENGSDRNGNVLYKSLANGKDYTLSQIFLSSRLTDEEKSVLLNNIQD